MYGKSPSRLLDPRIANKERKDNKKRGGHKPE
jgi:hypothetical protein